MVTEWRKAMWNSFTLLCYIDSAAVKKKKQGTLWLQQKDKEKYVFKVLLGVPLHYLSGALNTRFVFFSHFITCFNWAFKIKQMKIQSPISTTFLVTKKIYWLKYSPLVRSDYLGNLLIDAKSVLYVLPCLIGKQAIVSFFLPYQKVCKICTQTPSSAFCASMCSLLCK